MTPSKFESLKLYELDDGFLNLFDSNTFYNTEGIRVKGSKNKIIRNSFDKAWSRIDITGTIGTNISGNSFSNSPRFEWITSSRGSSVTYDAEISRNVFLNFTMAMRLFNSSGIRILNNELYNGTTTYDGWNVGIKLDRSFNNGEIINNILSDIGCIGVLSIFNDNVTIYNNTINLLSVTDSLKYGVHCSQEYRAGVFLAELYKTYIGDSTEVASYNYFNISDLHSSNINVSSNVFGTNVDIYLRTQGVANLSYSLPNYNFVSWRQPYFLDRDDFYLSESFNLSYVNTSKHVSQLAKQGYNGVFYTSYSFEASKFYFINLNGSYSNQTQFFNLTSALLTNGTSLCNGSSSDLSKNSGQVNITLNPLDSCYVFDNFKLETDYNRLINVFGIDYTRKIYQLENYVMPLDRKGLGNPTNAFNSSFVFLMGGGGAIISLLMIAGIFYMYYNGNIPFQTMIKTLIIAIIMFLVAGMILII